MRHVFDMRNQPPQIEMTINGEFVAPPRPPFMTRVILWAIGIAVLAAALSLAAFALWLALIILPVALGAAAVAYVAWRFQMWRAGRSIGGQRDLWRR